MKFEPASSANPVEEDGDHQVDDFIADEQAAEDGGGHGSHDFCAGAGGPEHGEEADDGDAFGEELGAEAMDSAFDDGLAQFGEGRNVFQAAAAVEGVAEVNEHNDAGFGGHSESGDVADGDDHAEVEAEKRLENQCAGECADNGEKYQQRVEDIVEGEEKQEKDQRDHQGEDDGQRVPGADLVFEFAGPFDAHAGAGEAGFDVADGLLGLVDEADDVAAGDVEGDVAAEAAVFAFDHARPFNDADVGDHAKGNLEHLGWF